MDRIRLTGPAALINFVFYYLLRKSPSCEPGVTGQTILRTGDAKSRIADSSTAIFLMSLLLFMSWLLPTCQSDKREPNGMGLLLASVRKPGQNDAYSPALFPKCQIAATLNSTTE